jgi:hypothetical protein
LRAPSLPTVVNARYEDFRDSTMVNTPAPERINAAATEFASLTYLPLVLTSLKRTRNRNSSQIGHVNLYATHAFPVLYSSQQG